MKCRGAVLRGVGRDWEVEEITLDPPREGEVLVKMAVRRALSLRRTLRHRGHGAHPGAGRDL